MAVIEARPPRAETGSTSLSDLLIAPDLPDVLRASASPLEGLRCRLVSWLGGHPRCDDAVIVVTELATNALTHGSRPGGLVAISIALLDGDRLEVRVWDEGRPTASVARCTKSRAETPGFGRGRMVVEALCEEVAEVRGRGGIGGGGWTVRAVLAAASPPLAEPDLDADDVEALLRAYPDGPDGDAGGDVELVRAFGLRRRGTSWRPAVHSGRVLGCLGASLRGVRGREGSGRDR